VEMEPVRAVRGLRQEGAVVVWGVGQVVAWAVVWVAGEAAEVVVGLVPGVSACARHADRRQNMCPEHHATRSNAAPAEHPW
jgi:hypothetical protein